MSSRVEIKICITPTHELGNGIFRLNIKKKNFLETVYKTFILKNVIYPCNLKKQSSLKQQDSQTEKRIFRLNDKNRK